MGISRIDFLWTSTRTHFRATLLIVDNLVCFVCRLSECGITEKDLESLTSALSSNPSHLKNLELSRNSFGSHAIAHLSDFLKHPDCQLQRLWQVLTHTSLQIH